MLMKYLFAKNDEIPAGSATIFFDKALSRARRSELEELVKRVVHCRLEAHPRFFDCFVEGCQFNPFASSSLPQRSTP